MARPESYTDLPGYLVDPQTFMATPDLALAERLPGVATAYGALTDALRAAGAVYNTQTHSWAVPRTEQQLQDALRERQVAWDRGWRLYDHWNKTGERPKHNYLWSDYLAAEDILVPDTDAVVVDQ